MLIPPFEILMIELWFGDLEGKIHPTTGTARGTTINVKNHFLSRHLIIVPLAAFSSRFTAEIWDR